LPNLVGIWNVEAEEEQIRRTLVAQLRRVRVPGIIYREYLSVFPGFGVALMDAGILKNGVQPAQTADGQISLWLDGELYNTDELKCSFRKHLPSSVASTSELCLHLVLSQGEGVVRYFNGLFCLVIYDQTARKLKLISDRYGFRPLFYARKGNSLLFGSELKAVRAADNGTVELDEIGTLEILCYGAPFRERTWIRGYVRLEPAHVLTVCETGVNLRRYWTYKYQENAPKLDQATYFTVFGTLLDRAVERCMQGSERIGVFLSGGYDSRSVAASIRKHHLPIPAFTFGHVDSRDVRFAAMLAEHLGLDHTALTSREPYLYSNCRAIVWRTEGMLPFTNTTSIRFHAPMKERMDIFLTGFLAEFGGSHTWPQLLRTRSRESAIRAIFDRILGVRLGAVQRVLDASFFKRTLEALRTRFDESFSNVENDHPLNVADCWNVIHLQPRSTYSAPCVDRPFFEARAPHMDAELVDFLLTIPPYARLEQRVYKKMIVYRFPEIRKVPCTNNGRPIDPSFAREYLNMLISYVGRRMAAVLRVVSSGPSLGREFRDLNEDMRAEPDLIERIFKPLMQEGIYPPSMFDLRAINDVLEEHYDKGARHENILALLISWGLAVKYFLREELSDVPDTSYQP